MELDKKKELFDILEVKRPTVAKLKESLIATKKIIEELEHENEQIRSSLSKAHDRSDEVYSANTQLLENCKALKLTISDLEGQLASRKAIKSYPLIVMIVIAVVEALIIFCLV